MVKKKIPSFRRSTRPRAENVAVAVSRRRWRRVSVKEEEDIVAWGRRLEKEEI
jgi:hypothetical protein